MLFFIDFVNSFLCYKLFGVSYLNVCRNYSEITSIYIYM